MSSRIKGITVEIGGNTTGLDKALKDVNGSINATQQSLKDVNRLLKLDPTNTQLLAQKQELLQKAISDTTQKLESLRSASAQLESKIESGDLGKDKFDALQREIIATEQKLNGLKSEAAEAGNSMSGSFEDMADGAGQAADGLSEVAEATKGIAAMKAGEIFSEMSGALKDLGSDAIDAAKEIGGIENTFQAFGFVERGAKELTDITKDVFASGFTDDANEAAKAVRLMYDSFGEYIDDTQLKNLSTQLLAISKRTETDLQENIRGTSQLMDAFGLDAQHAFDLMAQGYQWNLNESGDFMDTLNEFSPLFEDAGFSAEQMMNILSNGMRDGAKDVTVIGDAVKELQIKMGDGSLDESIESFSKETQNTFNLWKQGKATVADVATSISNDIKKMSPAEQQMALSLLASQFEDMGTDVVKHLFNIGDGFTDVTGKAQEFANATPGEKWQGSLNKLKLVMADIGETIMTTLQPVLDFFVSLAEKFSALPEPAKKVIVIIGSIVVILGALAPVIAAISTAMSVLNMHMLPVVAVIAVIAAAIIGLILIFKNWDAIVQWFSQQWANFKDWIANIWNGITQWFSEGVQNCINAILGLWNSISSTWEQIKQKTSETWQNIKDKVSNLASSAKEAAVNAIKNMASGIWNTLTSIPQYFTDLRYRIKSIITGWASEAWRWGSDFINGLKDGIMSGINAIVDKARELGNKIRSYLHFSRPDKGPLRDYETWMPDFMAGMAKGIDSNMYRVTDAVQRVANAMQLSMPNMDAALNVSGSGVSVNNAVTVQVGNRQFDAYIIQTAQKGISNNQRASMRAKGV